MSWRASRYTSEMRGQVQPWLKAGLLLAGAYGALVGVAFAAQRKLLYPAPAPRHPDPHDGELLTLAAPSGRPVFALWARCGPGARTVVHFHGNGEQLADTGPLLRYFHAKGLNALAVEYPGYGLAASQDPSEEGLYEAAETALKHLQQALGVPASEVTLVGHSLGTGVATEMALRGHGARLALLSPYTSIPEVAARVVPWLPARGLVRDRFATAEKAPRVQVPVQIVHGAQDELIPASMSRELGRLFPQADVQIIEGAHHNDLFAPPHGEAMLAGLVLFAR